MNVSGFRTFLHGVLSRRPGHIGRGSAQIDFRRIQHNEVTGLAQRKLHQDGHASVRKTILHSHYNIAPRIVRLIIPLREMKWRMRQPRYMNIMMI